MGIPRARAICICVWILVLSVGALLTAVPLRLRSSLPARLTTQWSPTGKAVGTTDARLFFGALVAIWLLGCIALVLASRFAVPIRLPVTATALGIDGLLVGLCIVTVTLNKHVADWHKVRMTPGSLFEVLVPALMLGAVGAVLQSGAGSREPASRGPIRIAWFGSGNAHAGLVAAPIVVLSAFLLASVVLPTPALALGTAAITVLAGVSLATARLRVAVTNDAVSVSHRRWLPTVAKVPLSDVVDSSEVAVSALRWGGWGYKYVRRENAFAVIVRSGPALRLDFAQGPGLVVTVDCPGDAARLINRLVRSRGGPPTS
jgi:hypothetical protein